MPNIERILCHKCHLLVPKDEPIEVDGRLLCKRCVVQRASVHNPPPVRASKTGRGYPPFQGRCEICGAHTRQAGIPLCDMCSRRYYGKVKHGRKSRGLKSCQVEKIPE